MSSEFINKMDDYSVNTKGDLDFSFKGCSSAEDCGLVPLSNAVGHRGKYDKVKQDFIVNKTQNNFTQCYNNIISLKNVDKTKYFEMITLLIKLVFHLRDPEDGNGERDIHYTMLLELAKNEPKLVRKLLRPLTGGYNKSGKEFSEMPFGSFLDLNKLWSLCESSDSAELKTFKNKIEDYYVLCLFFDKTAEYPTLAAKWAPSEGKKYNTLAKILAQKLFPDLANSTRMKSYRLMLNKIKSKLNLIEIHMSNKDWASIDVTKIPSKALKKYLYAIKNEIKATGQLRPLNYSKATEGEYAERLALRERFLTEISKNSTDNKLNVTKLEPYTITKSIINGQYTKSEENDIIALWNKYEFELHKKMEISGLFKNKMKMVVMADVSASMYGQPIEACIALSLLLTNLLDEVWKNKILTFETSPQWVDLTDCSNVVEKINKLKKAPWGGSTNIWEALDMILDVCIENSLTDEEKPPFLIVFSDMQFNQATNSTPSMSIGGYNKIKDKFTAAGYTVPGIIFWNLGKYINSYTSDALQKRVTMLSGFNPNSFKSFMNGDFNITNTPWDTLKYTLENSDRLSLLDKPIKKYFNET